MKRKNGLVLRTIGNQHLLVAVDPDALVTKGLVILNDTAAFIWNLIAEDCSTDVLSLAVAEQFNVDFKQAFADVEAFLAETRQMGLIEG